MLIFDKNLKSKPHVFQLAQVFVIIKPCQQIFTKAEENNSSTLLSFLLNALLQSFSVSLLWEYFRTGNFCFLVCENICNSSPGSGIILLRSCRIFRFIETPEPITNCLMGHKRCRGKAGDRLEFFKHVHQLTQQASSLCTWSLDN